MHPKLPLVPKQLILVLDMLKLLLVMLQVVQKVLNLMQMLQLKVKLKSYADAAAQSNTQTMLLMQTTVL